MTVKIMSGVNIGFCVGCVCVWLHSNLYAFWILLYPTKSQLSLAFSLAYIDANLNLNMINII